MSGDFCLVICTLRYVEDRYVISSAILLGSVRQGLTGKGHIGGRCAFSRGRRANLADDK